MTPEAIAAIFGRLNMAYGTRFMEQYGGEPPMRIRASWRHELADLTPAQVQHALAHLPGDYPINAMQFRDLARQLHKKPQALLIGRDGAAPSPEEQKRLERAVMGFGGPKDHLAWARKLRKREEDGERLSAFQRTAWRRALGFSPDIPEASIHAGCSHD